MTGRFFTIESPGKPHLHLDKFINIPVDKIHYQPETAGLNRGTIDALQITLDPLRLRIIESALKVKRIS